MKIGITTFQRAHNFGAQMQMYALYSFLRQKGYDVWILDYRCSPTEDLYTETNLFRNPRKFLSKRIYSGIKLLIRSLRSSIKGYQKIKCQRFSDFLTNNFQLTKSFDKYKDLPTDFDVLITGSDQLWNYNITNGRQPVYFLDNGEIAALPKRISYAVSAEKKYYSDLIADKEYVKRALADFSWVSVREKALADLLMANMNIQADVVTDPTLFLTREDCLKIAVKPKKEHYLCVYRVSNTSYLSKLAKIIAKECGLKIVNVTAATVAYSKAECQGPREILGYICYADAVLTSSFHGTVFSIINNIDFYCAYDAPSERIQNILSLLGMEDRFISSINDYQGFTSVQFDDSKIRNLVEDSQNRLLKAINNSNNCK